MRLLCKNTTCFVDYSSSIILELDAHLICIYTCIYNATQGSIYSLSLLALILFFCYKTNIILSAWLDLKH